MKEAIEEVRDRHYPKIREIAKIVANNQSILMIAIGKSPEIFIRPKTMVLHGVKVGFQKGKKSYVFDDEERVIENIKELFGKLWPENIEHLVRTKESVYKPALDKLSGEELESIGVEKLPASDEVVVKSTGTAVDKFVAALLKDYMEFEV
jgi:hypothetical protein